MLMFGFPSTIDLLAVANSVCWYGHVLRRVDGHVLRRVHGHLLRRVDGHVLRRVDGHVLRRVDGHVLRRVDGHVLRREDGHMLRREDGHVLRRVDGHVLRRVYGHVFSGALEFEVESQWKKWMSKGLWSKQVEEESVKVGMRREDALCRSRWSVGVNQIAACLRCIWSPSLV